MSYTTTALINNNKKDKKIYLNFFFQIRGPNAAGLRDLSSSPLLSSLLPSLLKFHFFPNFMSFSPFFGLFIAERARVAGAARRGGRSPYRPLRAR